MKRAVLFDMDGTLVDNMPYHSTAWVEFFRRRGRTIDTDDFFLRTTGRHSREIMRDYIGADLSDAECDALGEEKDIVYRELYAPHLRPLSGLEAFIAQAKAIDTELAVATAGPNGNIHFTLNGLGLRRHFTAVIGAADVKRGKPAPDVFLKAAEMCGVAPEHCIVFEDAPLGVQAARNAGMRTVALTTTMQAAAFSDFDNVIAIVNDFTGLSVEQLFRLPCSQKSYSARVGVPS